MAKMAKMSAPVGERVDGSQWRVDLRQFGDVEGGKDVEDGKDAAVWLTLMFR